MNPGRRRMLRIGIVRLTREALSSLLHGCISPLCIVPCEMGSDPAKL